MPHYYFQRQYVRTHDPRGHGSLHRDFSDWITRNQDGVNWEEIMDEDKLVNNYYCYYTLRTCVHTEKPTKYKLASQILISP